MLVPPCRPALPSDFFHRPSALDSGTMGKKSKKAARAGVQSGSAKPPRCDICVALIRKASNEVTCPGCGRIVCKRCEEKDFCRCPQPQCSLPTLRCSNCVGGHTFDMAVDKEQNQHSGDNIADEDVGMSSGQRQQLIFEKSQEWISTKPAALPFAFCDNAKDGSCLDYFCSCCCLCYEQGISTMRENKDHHPPLLGCARCSSKRCLACRLAATEKRGDWGDVIVCCTLCNAATCLKCDVGGQMNDDCRFICGNCCYWSAKPCTNPDCPNEVGVPTKRCGDCHRNRYCSKECQIAMRPAHKKECAKIMKKREKRAARRAEGERAVGVE